MTPCAGGSSMSYQFGRGIADPVAVTANHGVVVLTVKASGKTMPPAANTLALNWLPVSVFKADVSGGTTVRDPPFGTILMKPFAGYSPQYCSDPLSQDPGVPPEFEPRYILPCESITGSGPVRSAGKRSEEHTSELQSL